MRMDEVSFKEAFMSLGGEYQKPTFSSRLAVYRAQKQRSMRQKEADREREKRRLNNRLISVYRAYMERSEPLSDVWCDCYNAPAVSALCAGGVKRIGSEVVAWCR